MRAEYRAILKTIAARNRAPRELKPAHARRLKKQRTASLIREIKAGAGK